MNLIAIQPIGGAKVDGDARSQFALQALSVRTPICREPPPSGRRFGRIRRRVKL
jgi:hypothetical protein